MGSPGVCTLNTDASRIRAWFAGQQPQPPVPVILCELFSEHFGYPVRPQDIGFHFEADTDIGLVYQPSLRATVAVVADLGRNDVHRRDFLRTAPFVAVAAVASDDGRQALAQRYLMQALRLTQASGDSKFGSHVLAGMSDQACMLGHPREALQLAIAGRHGLTRAYSPACAADLWALQARAHGALGEAREAAHAVAQSEAAFGHIQREDEPEWARFIDPAYLAGEWANAFGDIARPLESTRFARHSATEAHTQNRARRGALSHAALARAALTPGHIDLDTAMHHAHQALGLTVTVKSSRCTAAITDLRTRIQPFRTVPTARDFDEQARLALAASHQAR